MEEQVNRYNKIPGWSAQWARLQDKLLLPWACDCMGSVRASSYGMGWTNVMGIDEFNVNCDMKQK
jgi:hypothetical protein